MKAGHVEFRVDQPAGPIAVKIEDWQGSREIWSPYRGLFASSLRIFWRGRREELEES